MWALAAGISVAAAAQQAAVGVPAVPAGDDNEVTLTGCVVKGDGGFVLANVTGGVAVDSGRITPGATGTATPPAPVGTTATIAPRMLYWLDDDDDLEDHAGHRVEVKGKIKDHIDIGEIEIEREEGMIELEIKAEGDKVTVKLPDTPATNAAAVGTTGTVVTDSPKDIRFLVRKFDVKSVKMLAPTCM